MFMKKIFIYVMICLSLTGCLATSPKKPMQGSDSVAFIDSEIFDQTLSTSMAASVKEITVTPVMPIFLNQTPDRLSKWLGAVAEKQGKVELDPKPSTKSLNLVLSLLPLVYDFLTAKSTPYELAKDYNATVFYQPETGKVNKVVFYKKSSSLPLLPSVSPATPM